MPQWLTGCRMILCRCLNCAFRGHSALKIDFEHIILRCNKLKGRLCKCWFFITQWCYIYMKKSWNSLSQQRKNELPLQNHPHRFQPCCDLFVCRWRILTSSRTIALKHPQFQRGRELVTRRQSSATKHQRSPWDRNFEYTLSPTLVVASLCMHVRCMHAIVTFITGVCCHVQLFALQLV